MYELEIRGGKLTIRYCAGAKESLTVAFAAITEQSHAATKASFKARQDYLKDRGSLRSPDHMNTEAELPDGSKFYAIKTNQGLRAYGWFSKKHRSVFYISHFICKKRQKLKQEDTNRVIQNWREIEE